MSKPEVKLTSPDKIIYKKTKINKGDFLAYINLVSSYILPYLKDRCITLIRFPNGISGEGFFQKNCPNYAPDFVQTHKTKEITYIVCNNIETLLWLGNQLAIEYHIPFETFKSNDCPSEIVFDLDPPSRTRFQLAVEAAQLIKKVLDKMKLISFVKTSGNKGLQVYIPLPEKKYTYQQIRQITKFIAEFLVAQQPKYFTIERMKHNRGRKLYVDYVQHAPGKTIIAPYSPRANKEALVSAPLHWNEVNDQLRPEFFSIPDMPQRISKIQDPWKDYFKVKLKQNLKPIMSFLGEQ